MRALLILAAVAIVATPILMFADAQHTIELPVDMTSGTDTSCWRATVWVDQYFSAHPAVRAITFTNAGWIPFERHLTRKQFYYVFSDCLVHGSGCH